ncbi:type II toxin-antitoxin system VapC family toxin [bacterium]|nr:type II toxin-antitoxin system VapC family toxin [bacterium]
MIFIDANIFMYAAGKPSPEQKPCQKFLEGLLRPTSREKYCINSEVLQEILHRYIAINKREVAFNCFDSIQILDLAILPIGNEELLRARRLLEDYPKLTTRDAIHIACMEVNQITQVATYDLDFEIVPWVKRVKFIS